MRINDFCERLYKKRESNGPQASVGVTKEMKQFIEEQLTKANDEALRLKQDERAREAGKFIPYRQISCDADCMAMFSMGPRSGPRADSRFGSRSAGTVKRKDPNGILPNDVTQQYIFFYGWTVLMIIVFIIFLMYFSYPGTHDPFTLSFVLLIFLTTLYLLFKDWLLAFKI